MVDIAATGGRDRQVTGLIGLAHASSHFYQLTLPPIFPLLREDFGVSYTELGGLLTIFYVVSGFSQAAAGFLVDRVGARAVLFAGLGMLASAILLIGFAPSVWALAPLMALAGLGNAVFHPADYSILTASVSEPRLGRAYSAHTLGGNLGWAAAPVSVLTLSAWFGWRSALIILGLAGLVILLLLIANRGAMHSTATHHETGEGGKPSSQGAGLTLLLSAPILLCFLYFTALSMVGTSLQSFLPTTLHALYGTPLAVASSAVTAYLLAAAAGIIVGGFLADRTQRHEALIAFGLAGAASMVAVVALVELPNLLLPLVIATAGFFHGTTTPSRDMLVRSITPRRATGRAFGLVYSGLDAGAVIAAPAIGLLLDLGRAELVLWLTAAVLGAGILTAVSAKQRLLRTA